MATRVTLIGHYPPPYGGVATLMAQMEKALTAAGLPVTVWNLGHGSPEGDDVVDFDDSNRVREVWQLWRAFAGSGGAVFHVLSSSYRSFWMASVCLVLAGLTLWFQTLEAVEHHPVARSRQQDHHRPDDGEEAAQDPAPEPDLGLQFHGIRGGPQNRVGEEHAAHPDDGGEQMKGEGERHGSKAINE